MITDNSVGVGRCASRGSGPRRAFLVMDARSRGGEYAFFQALDLLNASGVAVEASRVLHDPAGLSRTVREALEDGYDLVILGGEDRSVSSVADVMAGGDAILGLLPLGAANNFARTLEIPYDLEWACLTIARGKVVDVDLGLAGERHYVSVASAGLGVEATRVLSPLLERTAGALAYPVAAVTAFFRHRPFSARLTFPDGDHPPVAFHRLLHLAIGNGRFHGGGRLVAAGIDDGSLDVCAIELGRRRDLAGVARYLKSGEFIGSERIHHYRTSRVEIETGPRLPANLDGEPVTEIAGIFSTAPKALKVLTPENVHGSHDAAY